MLSFHACPHAANPPCGARKECAESEPLLPRQEGLLPLNARGEMSFISSPLPITNQAENRGASQHRSSPSSLYGSEPHLTKSQALAALNSPSSGKSERKHPQSGASLWKVLGKGSDRVSAPSTRFPWVHNTVYYSQNIVFPASLVSFLLQM